MGVRNVAVLVLALGVGALAQDPPLVHLHGLINDYTPASVSGVVAGPWEVRGVWSLNIKGESGTADFSAALSMVRSDEGVLLAGGDFNDPKLRKAHTHHITLIDGTVTSLPNGFRVGGSATITGNGNFPPEFGGSSTLQIDVTGGKSVQFSNIQVTFLGDSAHHFGSHPIHGVVRRPKQSDPDDTN